MKHIHIKLLADYQQHVPELATLWLKEIGKKWVPNASLDAAIETYQQHANETTLPLTFIALDQDKPIGMCSLRECDGLQSSYKPWLGSLIVDPKYRQKRVGESLIEAVKSHARGFGYESLYLFVLDPTLPTWYAKLGWKVIESGVFHDHPIKVMQIDL